MQACCPCQMHISQRNGPYWQLQPWQDMDDFIPPEYNTLHTHECSSEIERPCSNALDIHWQSALDQGFHSDASETSMPSLESID